MNAPLPTSNLLLFTGAGFTKNFGGFLAAEMWERIFNKKDVQTSQTLRATLQADQDYESVYSRVMNGTDNSDKTILRDVVWP